MPGDESCPAAVAFGTLVTVTPDLTVREGATDTSTLVIDFSNRADTTEDDVVAAVTSSVASTKCLLVGCTALGADTILTLTKLCTLVEIDLSRWSLGLDAMQALRGSQSLATLTLQGCTLTDDCISALGGIDGLRSLTSLDLSRCTAIGDVGLSLVVSCPLRDLNVSLCDRVGATCPAAWARSLPHVERLNLTATSCDDEALKELAAHSTSLRWLNLTRCVSVSDSGVQAIAANCTSLLSLYVAACTLVTDNSLAALGKWCCNLRELHIAGCSAICDDGLLALISGCTSLTCVIMDNVTVTDQSLVALAQRNTGLTTIQAVGCSGVGDHTVIALAHNCRSLRKVDLRGCGNVTEDSLAELQLLVPGCKAHVNSHLNSIW